MASAVLKFEGPEGTEEIFLDGDRTSFGRGSEADYRFDDSGLSRLHATIYRDGDRIWIVDENSTNGTFVNEGRVGGSGTPLKNGDTIRIGNQTRLKLSLLERSKTAAKPASIPEKHSTAVNSAASPANPSYLLPIAIIGFALFLISASAIFIGITAFGNSNTEVVQNTDEFEDDLPVNKSKDKEAANSETNSSKTPDSDPTPEKPLTNSNAGTTRLTDLPEANQQNNISLPSGKKYLEMSDAEKRQYITVKASKVAAMIGNRASGDIPALAIDRIKGFLDAYAKRVNVARMGGCRFGDNLQATYERASKNAPFIIRAFNSEGVDPQIGMYLAMIESEHCVCLQSPTGPLGMFQFTKATGEAYGLRVFKGASPSNPDERCQPEPAAHAAAKYMKFLTGRYGTGPTSMPLAIGSYNSGEGGLSKNLETALESNEGLPRDFWSMVGNADKLSKQFQSENFKYVPKYFAAAIVGENPQDFGLSLQPLSTYTK